MQRSTRSRTFRRLAALGLALFGAAVSVQPQAFDLPGTQPLPSSAPAAAKIQHEFVPPFGTPPFGQPCSDCHTAGPTPAAAPIHSWQGSMMAQSARDPLFYAQLDLTNHDGRPAGPRPAVAGMADMCLRCHSPAGWLEGRSTDLTGQGFNRKDLFGVQCHACHRLVDPKLADSDPAHPDIANFLSGLEPNPGLPPTYGNGMFVMDPKQTRRGPYSRVQMMPAHQTEVVGEGLDWNVASTVESHPAMNSAFHRSGNLCGTCHDVSNPVDCEAGAAGEDTQRCFPIERTWTEWRHSAFPARGQAGNCQSCHMSGPLNGVAFGAPCEGGNSLRHLNDIHFHDLTGGNAFVPAVILDMKQRYETCPLADPACVNFRAAVEGLYPPGTGSPFADVDAADLLAGIDRVKRTLKRAAYLDVTAVAPELTVRVTNRTGHKLPTGYPEGRRMWLNVRFLNASGDLIAESGRYDATTAALFHDQSLDGVAGPKSYDLIQYTDPLGNAFGAGRPTKVWEGRMDHQPTGIEFHFALNSRVLMDNRIPPEGWNVAGFTTDRALPVIPAIYATNGWQGDYGASGGPAVSHDEVDYSLPAGTDRVELTLFYQTASREYIEALAADNPNTLTAGGFNRGTLLQDAWARVGRSAPVVMARRVHAIVDTDNDGLSDGWESDFGGAVGGFNDDPDGDGQANWQEFQNGSDPTDGSSPGADRDPVDIVLVLDVSGSMNDPAPGTTTPKIQILKDSVTLFLETWKDYAVPGDRIGVVYFGNDAVPYGTPPLLKTFTTEWQAIRSHVQVQPAGGWTAMGAGLHTAVQGLGAFDPMNPRRRHVILFSNGMQNRSPMIVPHTDFPETLILRDQTPAENPEVTGSSSLVLGPGVQFVIPTSAGSLVRVHTVGIGVAENSGGTAWHKLLQDLANQQSGKHNFITRAFDLEGTFLEDLVQALRGNTLEYVLEAERAIPAGGEETFEIPVNATASRFSLVLSWSGQASLPPEIELLRPDGAVEDVGRLTRGGAFYRVVTRYLSNPDEHPEEFGTWVLRVRAPKRGPAGTTVDRPSQALRVRLHALLDDTELKYHFGVPGRRFRVGQPLRVTARAVQAGQTLRHLERVTVELAVPGAPVGAALAESRHRLDTTNLDPDLASTPFSRKLMAAFADERWRQRLTPTKQGHQLTDDGRQGDEVAEDGIFSRTLMTPTVPGHYELRFRMEGYAADGRPFLREETVSIVVGIGRIDPGRSRLRTVDIQGRPYVTLAPRDAAGNLLGPGYASQMQISVRGERLQVEDLLDGSYRALLPAALPPGEPVIISFDGEKVSSTDRETKDKYAAKKHFFEKVSRWFKR